MLGRDGRPMVVDGQRTRRAKALPFLESEQHAALYRVEFCVRTRVGGISELFFVAVRTRTQAWRRCGDRRSGAGGPVIATALHNRHV